MSYTFGAYAMIGLKIEKSKLTSINLVRDCDCIVPISVLENSNLAYCPVCGKDLWRNEEKLSDLIKDEKGEPTDYIDCETNTILGYPILIDNSYNYEDMESNFFVPIMSVEISGFESGGSEGKTIDLTFSLQTKRLEMREKFKEHNLWKDENFGLFVLDKSG